MLYQLYNEYIFKKTNRVNLNCRNFKATHLLTIFSSRAKRSFCDEISRMANIRKATADFGKITELSMILPETKNAGININTNETNCWEIRYGLCRRRDLMHAWLTIKMAESPNVKRTT